MNLRELLLLTLVGWTIVGIAGVTITLLRGERATARRHAGWIAGIWALYLAVLVGTSIVQRQRVMQIGQDQCFDEMCFAVTNVEELPGFLIRDGSRLVRVSVRITNRGRGKPESEELIKAYLLDAKGRRWEQSTGISGVRLTAAVGPGSSVISEPVFKVAPDASALGLVFTHGHKQPGVLVIGNSDSLWHKPTIVMLGL